jgi:hypothetical protein
LRLVVDRLGPVAAAEEVVAPLVTAVEAPRIVAVQVAHPEIQVRLAGLHDKVVVVAHQAVAVDPPPVAPRDAGEQVQEDDPIILVSVDRHARVPARRDVVVRAGKDRSQRSRHEATVAPRDGLQAGRHRFGTRSVRPRPVPGTGRAPCQARAESERAAARPD